MKNPDEKCGWILRADDESGRIMSVSRDCIQETVSLAEAAMRTGFTRIEITLEDRILRDESGGAANIEIIGEPGNRQVIPRLG